MSNKDEDISYADPLPQHESDFVKKKRLCQSRPDLAPFVTEEQPIFSSVENDFFSYKEKLSNKLMTNITKLLFDGTDLGSVMQQTLSVLHKATNSSGSTVYLVDDALEEIYQLTPAGHKRNRLNYKITKDKNLASYVADTKEFVNVADISNDDNFPEEMVGKSIMCVPVLTPENECLAVFKLCRDDDKEGYQDKDLRLVIVMCGWVGSTIYQNRQRVALEKQQELNEYMLDLIKCFFGDAMQLDKLITELINFAKIALNAEHGLFFMMKQRNDETCADLYEEGIGKDKDTMYKKNVMIKLTTAPTDLLNIVVQSGEILNIKNACEDGRVVQNKSRGYYITSVLSMPIKGVDETLGVIQMLNKKNGYFTKSDEVLFETFTTYCSFILSYALLCGKMTKSNNLKNIYSEMLAIHMEPCIHDYYFVFNHPEVPSLPDRFSQFDFYIDDAYEHYMPQLLMYMFNKISKDMFENVSLMTKFILIVQKSYHNHPYHNFQHAFSVCHCMYTMLRRNMECFTPFELKAFMVATYCHDVDHYGVTNNFLEITNHYLAQLYDGSLLENHHYHVTAFIIKSLKLFQNMSQEEYKAFLAEIKTLILATDLATYFKKRGKIYQICTENEYNWNIDEHRTMFKGLMMTMADLSGVCKPFRIAKYVIDHVYKEFYNEGDKEKEMGLCPLSIMDREKANMIVADQIQFVTVVVLPCALIIMKILPNCASLYKDAVKLRETWQEIQENQKTDELLLNNNERPHM